MKKLLLLLIAINCFTCSYSQKEAAVKSYKQGTKALEQKKYHDAISLLTASINLEPTPNAYFNRAVAYYNLRDSCSFCNDLKNAAELKDYEALELYSEKCTYSTFSSKVPDSIKSKYPQVSKLKIAHLKCSEDTIIFAVADGPVHTKIIELSDLENANLAADTVPEIFTIVEEMPVYEGGDEARNKFLADNIVYPQLALKYKIQGTVYVSFIVEKNGAVSNVKILRGIGGGCDEETVRVVKLMNKWKPGSQNGKNTRVLFNMPVYFKLKG
jgi:TonB family protein